MSVFEITMLVCFGASWPFNLYKTYRSKSAAGLSFGFLTLVAIGYGAGIIDKILYHNDQVLYLWLLNEMMVSAEIVLMLTYRHRENNRPPLRDRDCGKNCE